MTGKEHVQSTIVRLAVHICGRVLICSLVILLPTCTCHREGEDRFSDVRSKVLDFMDAENVPSVSVGVAQHGKIVWEESFGLANREKGINATPATRYELASIAKLFTTTAIMVLQERGRLDIDSPVQRYLGDVKITAYGTDPSQVTLRRIIQHTSGLPMFWGQPYVSDTGSPLTQKDIFRRYAILAFNPGERELYSNLGIGLLTYVIEMVSGESYENFLQKEVFGPLGMFNTVRLSTPARTDEYAQQYDHQGKPWTYPDGMYASAHDLLRFGMFHLKDRLPDQRQILMDSTLERMQTSIDPHSDFRLPWWVWEYDGYPALVFTGASGTIIALLPEADLAIVVLANRLQADTPKIARWIADVILEDFDDSRRLPTSVRTAEKSRPAPLLRGSLTGVWGGSLVAAERTLPVELSFGRTGFPQMRIASGDGSWREWAESMPTLRGDYSAGVFSAYFPARLPLQDTKAHNHWTWVYLGLNADTLQGYAVAHAADGPHFGLPYYLRLERLKHDL